MRESKTNNGGASTASEILARLECIEGGLTGFQVPVVWECAEGATVLDVDQNRYLDWTSGVLVANVGHAHPRLVAAISAAATNLLNCYAFPTELRVKAGESLLGLLPSHLDRCAFLTTGSEAVEACLRVMKKTTGAYEVIGFQGGFHGRTPGVASVGGLSSVKEGFGPSLPGTIRAPYPNPYRSPVGGGSEGLIDYCMTRLDEEVRASSTGSLAGLIVEPYLGTAGFIFPPDGYLSELQGWARDRGLIFAVDEVQSGCGRTGQMWAFEWENLEPDLVAFGKGIGSGYPVSALGARAELLASLAPGDLGSTFGGNPVGAAAVVEVFNIMDDERLVENALSTGSLMKERLLELQDRSPFLGDVRGRGLVIGLEIVVDKDTKEPSKDLAFKLLHLAAENGLLMGAVGEYGNVIRVAPPLCITEEQAMESLDRLAASLDALAV